MDDQDRQRLVEFVNTVETWLQSIIQHGGAAIPDRHRTAMHAAWQEVRPKFRELIEAIESRTHDTKLDDVGLSGKQLDFKLGLVAAAQEGLDAEGPSATWTLRKWASTKIKRLLAKLLRAINLALGSLASAISVAEPIKEIKEALEQLLDISA